MSHTSPVTIRRCPCPFKQSRMHVTRMFHRPSLSVYSMYPNSELRTVLSDVPCIPWGARSICFSPISSLWSTLRTGRCWGETRGSSETTTSGRWLWGEEGGGSHWFDDRRGRNALSEWYIIYRKHDVTIFCLKLYAFSFLILAYVQLLSRSLFFILIKFYPPFLSALVNPGLLDGVHRVRGGPEVGDRRWLEWNFLVASCTCWLSLTFGVSPVRWSLLSGSLPPPILQPLALQ